MRGHYLFKREEKRHEHNQEHHSKGICMDLGSNSMDVEGMLEGAGRDLERSMGAN